MEMETHVFVKFVLSEANGDLLVWIGANSAHEKTVGTMQWVFYC